MEDGHAQDVLKQICHENSIHHLAYASVSSWYDDPLVSSRIPKGKRPDDILPGAKSVIVIGVPIQYTILKTAPSIYYRSLYNVVNDLLDNVSERMTLELMNMGYESLYIPRDGYRGVEGLRNNPESFFSHRHAAYLAGMGTFGWNNMLLTPDYGPRMRFTSVITTIELPYGKPMDDDLCLKCGRCTRVCPASAVPREDYPRGTTDKMSCVGISTELARKGISPCGRCITECPVGKDNKTEPKREATEAIRRI